METLHIKKRPLKWILKGLKTLEIRLDYPDRYHYKVGHTLLLDGRYQIKILDIRIYDTFDHVLQNEPLERIMPEVRSAEEAKEFLETFYPVWKQKKYGIKVFEIELVN